jgi:hypothetical protein
MFILWLLTFMQDCRWSSFLDYFNIITDLCIYFHTNDQRLRDNVSYFDGNNKVNTKKVMTSLTRRHLSPYAHSLTYVTLEKRSPAWTATLTSTNTTMAMEETRSKETIQPTPLGMDISMWHRTQHNGRGRPAVGEAHHLCLTTSHAH